MASRDLTLAEAEREADRRRQRAIQAAEALKDRVESDLERARESQQAVTAFVRRHRWPLLAGVFAFGFGWGVGRRRPVQRIPVTMDPDERAVVLVRESAAPPSSLAGMVASLVARRLASSAAEAVGSWAKERIAAELDDSDGHS
jgi:hypothetical protein